MTEQGGSLTSRNVQDQSFFCAHEPSVEQGTRHSLSRPAGPLLHPRPCGRRRLRVCRCQVCNQSSSQSSLDGAILCQTDSGPVRRCIHDRAVGWFLGTCNLCTCTGPQNCRIPNISLHTKIVLVVLENSHHGMLPFLYLNLLIFSLDEWVTVSICALWWTCLSSEDLHRT